MLGDSICQNVYSFGLAAVKVFLSREIMRFEWIIQRHGRERLERPVQAFAFRVFRNEDGLGGHFRAVHIRADQRAVVFVVVDIASHHAAGDEGAGRSDNHWFRNSHGHIVDIPASIIHRAVALKVEAELEVADRV